ncbi:hypothetical protein OIU78_005963, partial [Salix suchowensis]
MARSLTVSLSKTYYLTSSSSPTRCSSRLLTLRAQSNIPNRNNPSESDDSSSSSSTDPLLRKLEDAIHGIIVRRAAPDWLPFLPGSSYWVPPPRSASGSLGIAHLVEKLANPLSDEESLSTSTVRGWPSSDYFVEAPLVAVTAAASPSSSSSPSASSKSLVNALPSPISPNTADSPTPLSAAPRIASPLLFALAKGRAPPQPVEVVEDRSYSLENRHLGLSKHFLVSAFEDCLGIPLASQPNAHALWGLCSCFQSPCAVGEKTDSDPVSACLLDTDMLPTEHVKVLVSCDDWLITGTGLEKTECRQLRAE